MLLLLRTIKTRERDYKLIRKSKFTTAFIASASSKKLANVDIRLPKLNFNLEFSVMPQTMLLRQKYQKI